MMTASLAQATDRGDAVSILIAARWPIYGRYGYGPGIDSATYSIDTTLVRRLVRGQFPRWADLPVTPLASGGTVTMSAPAWKASFTSMIWRILPTMISLEQPHSLKVWCTWRTIADGSAPKSRIRPQKRLT